MNTTKKIFAITLFMMAANSALAAKQTVILSVEKMTCAACPITVKKALGKVSGVEQIDINFESKEAVVTFDDTKTNANLLTEATLNAGYPSTVKAGK